LRLRRSTFMDKYASDLEQEDSEILESFRPGKKTKAGRKK
jgi:hypothetical protein